MPVFEFKGRSYEGGGITNGIRTAPSRQAVAAMLRNEKMSIHSWWTLSLTEAKNASGKDLGNSISELDAIFHDASRLRLRADVPVGAYLSGGIDSSLTTGYIQKIVPDMLRTFSIGFANKDFDESEFQNIAVKHFKTDHTAINCTDDEIAGKFPDIVWHTEIPLLRTAPTPMYYLSGIVRENNYKVVITGEGADEIFGGYARYLIAYFEQCIKAAIDGTMNNGNFIVTYESIIPNLEENTGWTSISFP